MIKNISGSVTFTTPPITLAVDFQPQTGITAVVGPNGSGKSFAAVELCRYLLYGKAALRGAASDYKTLEARGTFTIRGIDYDIVRLPGGENISIRGSGEALAVGAKAVTEKVTELMGYGLAVFDIANASVQKSADNFGKMPPAERKRMIDRVVGMTSIEQVEKSCREEARMFKREAEALERTLPVIAPVVAPSARFSDVVAEELERWEAYDRVQRRVIFVQRPEQPSGTLPTPEALNDLEGHERARLAADESRARLQRRIVLTKHLPLLEERELDRAEARVRVAKAIRERGPAPQFPAAEAERYWAQHAVFDAYVPSDEIECPNCQHHFHVTGAPPPTPMFSKQILRDDDQRRAKHAGPALELPEGPDLMPADIAFQRQAWQQLAENARIESEIAALPDTIDLSAELMAARARQAEWAAYSIMCAAADKAEAQNDVVIAELEEMGTPPAGSIESLRGELEASRLFEQQWVAYDQSVIRRAAIAEQIAEKLRLAEEFRLGGEALGDARTTMKAYLAPAISRAASALLEDMTHGKLSSVMVDEDMEITVNGQRIETLSGGGETVANIALRIALGQVLVVDTFPVFIGDEMDADADDTRREAVLEAMVSLKDHLSQIIIVTHRGVEVADHVFDMQNSV